MRPLIVIDDFSRGIMDDITLPVRDGFGDCKGIDIFSEPGILQVSQKLDPMPQADPPNNITDGITWMVKYSKNGVLYGLGDGGSGRIYDWNNTQPGKWALAHDDVNVCWGQGMIEYNGNLYWASNSYLGKFDGTTWIDSFRPLNFDWAWHPMVIFGDDLMIGSGRYIDKLDSSEVMRLGVLDLPEGYKIRCLAVYNNRLMIGTWRGLSIYEQPEASLFSWDGSSPSFEHVWTLKEAGIHAMIPWKNLLVVFAGVKGNIYLFNGATLQKIKSIPDRSNFFQTGYWIQTYPGAVTEYFGNLLFGISAGTSGEPKLPHGIYTLGRKSETDPLALVGSHILSSGLDTYYAIYSIFVAGNNLFYVSYSDGNGVYKVDKLNIDSRIISGAYWESQIYEISQTDLPVPVKGVEVIAQPLASNNSITVKYKLDNASSWTTLGTITAANQNKVLLGIKSLAKTIQIRLEFTTNPLNNYSPKISQIRIY